MSLRTSRLVLVACAGALLASGCQAPSSPGKASTGASGSGCSATPCGSSNGVTVSLTGLDQWAAIQAGTSSGVKFLWHIDNGTGTTLSFDESMDVTAYNANHAQVDTEADIYGPDGKTTDVKGCGSLTSVRIPPHQTVSASAPLCLGVQQAQTAAVVEFGVDVARVDVALPSSYGTGSDPCPSDTAIATAIAGSLAGTSASSIRITGTYCKGNIVAVKDDLSDRPKAVLAISNTGNMGQPEPVYTLDENCQDPYGALDPTQLPALIARYLGC